MLRAGLGYVMGFLGVLGCCGLAALPAAADDGAEVADADVAATRPQINLRSRILDSYPHAQAISFVIATVPDPRVPRYRRLYDLSIDALQLGMLSKSYVLDRWAVPWASGAGKPPAHHAGSANFGLMVFRCDVWRDADPLTGHRCDDPSSGAPPARVRGTLPDARLEVVYLVPETATQGVEFDGLCESVRRIDEQLPGDHASRAACSSTAKGNPAVRDAAQAADVEVGLMSFPDAACRPVGRSLVVLGPAFSGSLESVRTHRTEFTDDAAAIQNLCLISSSASVISNDWADDAGPITAVPDPPSAAAATASPFHYRSLAVSDFQKFAKIGALADAVGRDGPVVLMSESSVFGFGAGNDVCGAVMGSTQQQLDRHLTGQEYQSLLELCAGLHVIYFPPTIADIRYGVALKDRKNLSAVAAAAKNSWPSDHLDLDLGADVGTEFPDNHQSSLTAASLQLTLDQAMASVRLLKPSMVVLVATDVRDRLFLFELLRTRLPTVTLVDLETDNLLTHPDFLHASRGAFAVASAKLTTDAGEDARLYGCEPRSTPDAAAAAIPQHQYWPTDVHGIFADAVGRLRDADQPVSRPPCIVQGISGARRVDTDRHAILNVVGLSGFKTISRAYPAPGGSGGDPGSVRALECYGPILCLLLAPLWLLRVLLPRVESEASTEWARPSLVQRRWQPWAVPCAALLEALFLILLLLATLQVGPRFVGPAPLAASTVLCALCMLGLWHCLRRLDDVHPRAADTPVPSVPSLADFWIAAGPALAAVGIATAPFLRSHFDHASTLFADERQLVILGSTLGSGLAFFGVIVLGAFVMHFASVVLATTAYTVRRNLELVDYLEPTPQSPAGGPPAGVPLRASLPLPTPNHRFSGSALLSRVSASVVLLLLAAIGIEVWLGGMRISVFGRFASWAAFLALCAATVAAGLTLALCFTAAQRIRIYSGYVQAALPERDPAAHDDGEIFGFWPRGPHVPLEFAATPVLARPSDAGRIRGILERPGAWKRELAGVVGGRASAQQRLALFLLLASEMSIFRWLVLATLVSCLSSVLMVYLFPIEADILVGIDLLILIAIGLLSGFMAATFEGDGVLSNILCNRPRKAAWSNSLFSFIVAPFAVLAVAILIVDLPGVIDWGGGLLSLVTSLGVHP